MNLNLVASCLLERTTESISGAVQRLNCKNEDEHLTDDDSAKLMKRKLRTLLSNGEHHKQLVSRFSESGIFETGQFVERFRTVEKGKLHEGVTKRVQEVFDELHQVERTSDELMGKIKTAS